MEKYPFELFGVECADGWKSLLQPIFDYVEQYNKEHEEHKLEFLQVKEKFGGLRVYMNFETEELQKLIEEAESKSYLTCEFCGATENVGTIINGWISTCCEDCAKRISENRKTFKEVKWKSNSTKEVKSFIDGKEQ